MADAHSIGAETLRSLLHYDPETGGFTRATSSGTRWKAGQSAGAWDLHGYKTIRLGRKSYKAHRLAWLYMTGEWPHGDIDHINGVRHDNRWANLRDVPRGVNLQNQRATPSHNRSTRVQGVYPAKGGNYSAAISINNRKKHIGTYSSIEEARAAYIEAKRRLHPGSTI